MPSQKERRQLNVANRARFGGSANANAYTQFAGTDGWQTQSGCARAYKEIYLRPYDFDISLAASTAASVGATSGCSTGSFYGARVLLPVTGSTFTLIGATGSPTVMALNMGAGASPASPLIATAFFPRPADADTTGSIIAYVDWTSGIGPATTGSKIAMAAAIGYLGGYLGTAVAVRTAASTGGVGVASYSGTTCGFIQTSCLGKLPSWGACDTGGVFVFQLGASAGADSGKLDTGCTFILGVRLRYLTNVLGFQSAE